MTVPRSKLVDTSVTCYYHCISRCVRGALLCGQGYEHRKDWIETRLEELVQVFAVETCGYAVLDNHFHALVKLEPQQARRWSDEEVARRWGALYPPRGKKRQPLPVTDAWVQEKLRDQEWVICIRDRLCNLGWFMKCLKEPLARLANKEDGTRGAFWQSRYKSIAVLDDEALLATLTYIDLNPLAAGLANVPEESPYTSIRTRVEHCRASGSLEAIVKLPVGAVPDQALEDADHWLCPIQYIGGNTSLGGAGSSEVSFPFSANRQRGRGMIAGFTLSAYLRLLDWSSRVFRRGKARVSREVQSILKRLGTSPDVWRARLQMLMGREQLLGVAFASSRDRLKQAAGHRGCQRLANLNGSPA